MKERKLRRFIREEIKNVIQEENKGLLYSYAGDINIYDLSMPPMGGTEAPQSGNKIVALEFGGNRIELTPNEAESLYSAVETIYNSRS